MVRVVLVGVGPTPIGFLETGVRSAQVGDTLYGEAAAGAAYTLTAAGASFTLTGQTASFGQINARQLILAGQPTPIIVTESANRQSVVGNTHYNERTPVISFSMSAERGAFTLSGQAATLVFSGAFAPQPRAFVLSGQVATLRRSRIMGATTGVFTYSVASTAEGVISLPGAFAITGGEAALNYTSSTIKLIAASGSFTVSGPPVELIWSLDFAVAAGSFALTGQSASFLRPYRVVAEVGVFGLSSVGADLIAPRIIAYPIFPKVITAGPS